MKASHGGIKQRKKPNPVLRERVWIGPGVSCPPEVRASFEGMREPDRRALIALALARRAPKNQSVDLELRLGWGRGRVHATAWSCNSARSARPEICLTRLSRESTRLGEHLFQRLYHANPLQFAYECIAIGYYSFELTSAAIHRLPV